MNRWNATFRSTALLLMLTMFGVLSPSVGLSATPSPRPLAAVSPSVPTLAGLPVIYVGLADTTFVRSFDADGNFISDIAVASARPGNLPGVLATDYVTVSGPNTTLGRTTAFGNVVTADPVNGTVLVRDTAGLVPDQVIDAGFDANDQFVVGDAFSPNEFRGSPDDARQSFSDILVADPDTGRVAVYAFDWFEDTPAFELKRDFDAGFELGGQLAVGDVTACVFGLPCSANTSRSDGLSEILVVDASTGVLRVLSPNGSPIAQFNEADVEPGDIFVMGNYDGAGVDEAIVADAARDIIEVFNVNTGTAKPLVASIQATIEPGDAIATGDITGNGMEEIVVASAAAGTATIYLRDVRFDDPSVIGDEFVELATVNVGYQAGNSFSVLPVRYADSDEDGLYDDWETFGYDANSDGVVDVDLPALGADPLHKDIFLELDYVQGLDISGDGIRRVKEAFAAAPAQVAGRSFPTSNPDGQSGINLWIDTGTLRDSSGVLVGDNLGGGNQVPDSGTSVCTLDSQFYAIKAGNFSRSRSLIFRYGLRASNSGCTRQAGGFGEIGGNDFVVFNGQGGIIMHELGHTLNLGHGGIDSDNCKPNYVSVMNYDHNYGIPQAGGGFILDFSPPRRADGSRTIGTVDGEPLLGAPPMGDLDEANLDETAILDPNDGSNFTIFTNGQGQKMQSRLDQPIDWNGDGDTSDTGVSVNIDTQGSNGQPKECDNTSTVSRLRGHDDWSNMSIRFREFGDSADGALDVTDDLTPTFEAWQDLQQELVQADLAIAKTDEPDPAIAGEAITYTLTVTNLGPGTATAVQVIDTLPDGVTYASDDAGCVVSGRRVDCDLGTLVAGEARQITIAVGINADLVYVHGGPTVIGNQARVVERSGVIGDPNPNNNAVSELATIVAAADLELVASDAQPARGEILMDDSTTVTIQHLVANHGPSSPMDVLLTSAGSADGLVVTAVGDNPADVLALSVGEPRAVSQEFAVSCTRPGEHLLTFEAVVDPARDEDQERDAGNNRRSVETRITCVVPVAINVYPGGSPNRVNIGKPVDVPLAVLSTSVGEYGLPLEVDATTIEPLSVVFGPRDALLDVATLSGASESHGAVHVEDAIELDESSRDGDLDAVLHFPAAQSGLVVGDNQACVRGLLLTATGESLPFFGCDAIVARP